MAGKEIDMTLRNKLIRLAHEKPGLRGKLLPLLSEGQTKVAESGPFTGERGGKWADKEHTIPWHDKKHSGKPAPKAKAHDEHESHNLHLISEHNARPHHGGKYPPHGSEAASEHRLHASKEHIKANLIKHVSSGKYCHAQATKSWASHAKLVSDHNKKFNGGGAADPATRNHAAKQMADEFHDELKDGEHDDHEVLTGVHKKRSDAGGGISAMAKKHGKKK